ISNQPQRGGRGQTLMTEPLEKSWIRKNDESEDESEDESMVSVWHETSLSKINDKLSLDDGPLDESPRNQAFIAWMVEIDSSVKNDIHDIEKLHHKIFDKIRTIYYFRRKNEY